MVTLNETHDPSLVSWVESANLKGSDFPIQNLPFAVFRRRGSNEPWRGGVAIGEQILDMHAAFAAGIFSGDAAAAAGEASLNRLMDMGPAAWSDLRLALSRALRPGAREAVVLHRCLVAQADAEYSLPAQVGDYTDFYTSVHHATNIGRLFRPDNPLMPNYKWIPIGYHGRASSLIVSGENFHRPCGQILPPGASAPVFAASRKLDIELELAVYIGRGNAHGHAIPLAEAESHVFGVSLLNDWSARDIQAWEYQPLGPFLAKNFASTLSPWIVTLEALAPYRTAPPVRDAEDPELLPYLNAPGDREEGALDIQLEVLMQTARMRAEEQAATRLSATNYRHAYWTLGQMVAHHTVNGCNLRAGDILGTGTLSGPTLDQAAALIELTVGGKQPVVLPNGEQRTFVEDGDRMELRGWCERAGAARIGFGECVATLLPALA